MDKNTYYLKKFQLAKKAQKIILETIGECKHWKKIDARFVEKLKAKKLKASVENQAISGKTLKIFDNIDGRLEDIIHCDFEDTTWDDLSDNILKNNWSVAIKLQEEKIARYAVEERELRKIIHGLKQIESKNFHHELSAAIRQLEKTLKTKAILSTIGKCCEQLDEY